MKGEMNIFMVGATWGQRGGGEGGDEHLMVGATWGQGRG